MITEKAVAKQKALFSIFSEWLKELISIDTKLMKLAEPFRSEEVDKQKLQAANKYNTRAKNLLSTIQGDIDTLEVELKKTMFPLWQNTDKPNSLETENTNALLFVSHLPGNYVNVLDMALSLGRYDFFFTVSELLNPDALTIEFEELYKKAEKELGIAEKKETIKELKELRKDGEELNTRLSSYRNNLYWEVTGLSNLMVIETVDKDLYNKLYKAKYPIDALR
jgi:hypothetical protein